MQLLPKIFFVRHLKLFKCICYVVQYWYYGRELTMFDSTVVSYTAQPVSLFVHCPSSGRIPGNESWRFGGSKIACEEHCTNTRAISEDIW